MTSKSKVSEKNASAAQLLYRHVLADTYKLKTLPFINPTLLDYTGVLVAI